MVEGVRSNTAPAVLGLDSGFSRGSGGVTCSGGPCSATMGVVVDRRLEMLPETEWLGLTVTVLEVSLDISDSGRGMNSTVSENPTRARAIGFVSRAKPMVLGRAVEPTATGFGSVLTDSVGWAMIVGPGSDGKSLAVKSDGLVGALSPLGTGDAVGGCSIIERSWLDNAAERLCAWRPRRFGGGPVRGPKPDTDLTGLVFMMLSPSRMLPPTNSLPPRRCQCPPALEGEGKAADDGGEIDGLSKPLL